MGMLEIWKGVLTKPADTFKAEKKNATIGEGAKHLAIGYFVLGLVLGLAALLGLGALGGAAGAMLGVVGFIVSVVFYPVIGIIVSLIVVGVVWVMAKILGGKGDYGVQFGYYGMLMAPVIVINAVLTFVPIVGGLVGLLVALYALYLLTISIKEAHQLDTSKAVLAWLIPAIVISIVAMIIFGAAVMSMGGLGALGARRF